MSLQYVRCLVRLAPNLTRLTGERPPPLSCPMIKRYHADETFLLVALTALYTMAENQPENQHLILAGMHG